MSFKDETPRHEIHIIRCLHRGPAKSEYPSKNRSIASCHNNIDIAVFAAQMLAPLALATLLVRQASRGGKSVCLPACPGPSTHSLVKRMILTFSAHGDIKKKKHICTLPSRGRFNCELLVSHEVVPLQASPCEAGRNPPYGLLSVLETERFQPYFSPLSILAFRLCPALDFLQGRLLVQRWCSRMGIH